jgi:hypothetical protein
MFQDPQLQEYIETSSTIRSQSSIIAEWNMNIAENIRKIGNYRNRPDAVLDTEDFRYANIESSFDINDAANSYTGATDADIVVDGGFDKVDGEQTPILFLSKKEKEKLLYSLEDCFGKRRPRSGINKLRYFSNNYSHHANPEMANRPRYYMADKEDPFKYWTSYRSENGIERGIASNVINGQNKIEDAAPFIVYKNDVPANRIVVKMQTNVGTTNLGPFVNDSGSFPDPFFGSDKQTTPVRWSIQYLEKGNWVNAISFNPNSTRRDGSAVIGPDGYVEIAYGVVIPDIYRDTFVFAGEYPSEDFLPAPTEVSEGTAYWVQGERDLDPGTYYIAISGEYQSFAAQYGWALEDEAVTSLTNYVTDLTSPRQLQVADSASIQYREFQYVGGLRVVVETMNTFDSTFDLIELSPRLTVDLSDKVKGFSVTKSASDLGVSGLPVGQLLASTGSVDIFDYDQAFFPTNIRDVENNTGSIVAEYTAQNIQVKFYEVIVAPNAIYYVPIKTMYSEGFPQISSADRSVSLSLRDLFYYFEALTSPQLLIQNASISSAISLLLDSIGFSNYVYRRNPDEDEMVIPFFAVGPDRTIAQVLADIAISSQSAMFFDEFNNFVVMSKNYIMPQPSERQTSISLYGSKDFVDTGIIENEYSNQDVELAQQQKKLANIIDLAAQDNVVYNDGSINYTTRYIQRSYSSIKQASLVDRDKTWIYKPALLWEVGPSETTKSVNDELAQQSSYTLSAIPLNSDLSDLVPAVVNNQVINNVIDLGDGIYWLSRYNGYFYANGEIIKYDAVQYSIPGLQQDEDFNVWITSVQEYQKYFAKVPFNGKIYPTGLVRIYAEPNYEIVEGIPQLKNGSVAKHGRMQFGTGLRNEDGSVSPVYHHAGLSQEWSSDDNVRGVNMDFTYITNQSKALPEVTVGSAGIDNARAKTTSRNGIIKNFLSNVNIEESAVNRLLSSQTGTVQSSAFIMNGSISAEDQTPNFVTYVPKRLEDRFVHFGTRMRIIGRVENNESRGQSPSGVSTYYTANSLVSDQAVAIGGASGGIAVMLDSETGNGYYFEIMALTENNLSNYQDADNVQNVIFYKNMKRDAPNVTIIGKELLNGTVTLTTDQPHKYLPGDQVTVSNVGTPFDGLYTIIDISEDATEFSYLREADNVTLAEVSPAGSASVLSDKSIPVKLWGGISSIVVDNGLFTGQYRMSTEETPTVYDLAVEYQKIGDSLKFYLYINNVLVKIVDDPNPLPIYNNIAPFVRGSSRVMFENIYALTNNYSQNTVFDLDTISDSVFGDQEINASQSLQKYSLSGIIQSSYLTGIGPSEPPKYKIYFEEFGTIMREAAYFNVRYDKAYPALYAKLSPTFNKIKGYTISNFIAGAYRSEFLIFNATDTVLSLDSTSGNYLRIQGVTFTQQSQHELTVDEFFSKRSDQSNPEFSGDLLVRSPQKIAQDYQDIKFSRLTYGKRQFSITAPFIQSQDDASNLMKWLSEKIMVPRRSLGVKIFSNPMIQLGDIVEVLYKNNNGVDEATLNGNRFVVYSIEYSRDNQGPDMTLYLSEVK